MELIPAITSFYLHPDNRDMRACVKLLTNQWQSEMEKFRSTIDLIIDPAAYCQVCKLIENLEKRLFLTIN